MDVRNPFVLFLDVCITSQLLHIDGMISLYFFRKLLWDTCTGLVSLTQIWSDRTFTNHFRTRLLVVRQWRPNNQEPKQDRKVRHLRKSVIHLPRKLLVCQKTSFSKLKVFYCNIFYIMKLFVVSWFSFTFDVFLLYCILHNKRVIISNVLARQNPIFSYNFLRIFVKALVERHVHVASLHMWWKSLADWIYCKYTCETVKTYLSLSPDHIIFLLNA